MRRSLSQKPRGFFWLYDEESKGETGVKTVSNLCNRARERSGIGVEPQWIVDLAHWCSDWGIDRDYGSLLNQEELRLKAVLLCCLVEAGV